MSKHNVSKTNHKDIKNRNIASEQNSGFPESKDFFLVVSIRIPIFCRVCGELLRQTHKFHFTTLNAKTGLGTLMQLYYIE